jgi:hypothetical protein
MRVVVAIWVVMGILILGAAVAVIAARHARDDVEPSVREFTEFRHAISRQVAGLEADTHSVRNHLDRRPLDRQSVRSAQEAGERPTEGTAPRG